MSDSARGTKVNMGDLIKKFCHFIGEEQNLEGICPGHGHLSISGLGSYRPHKIPASRRTQLVGRLPLEGISL